MKAMIARPKSLLVIALFGVVALGGLVGAFFGVKYIVKKIVSKKNDTIISENIEQEDTAVLGESDTQLLDVDFTNSGDKYIYVCDGATCTVIYYKDLEKMYADGVLDETLFRNYVNAILVPYFDILYSSKKKVYSKGGDYWFRTSDVTADLSNLYADVITALQTGENGFKIIVNHKNSAGTDGTFATKYMEVDTSQQMLYVWSDGSIVKEMQVSGAKYGYQVFGAFTIFTKSLLPVTDKGEYMPYWMAFYYSASEQTSYGLHALVWWYDGNHNVVYEPESALGTMKSEGCIRMSNENAEYLYNMFNIGDYVLIHE
ncbi:L,D-transpeptidase [bacterium]|nr:L,D-transpeptidase [bacterium]